MAAASKVALVTGAGTGIGKASAKALAKAGYALVLAGRRKEPLEAVKKEIETAGGKALAVACDVGKPDQVKALFAETKETFGRLDVLFNNAGMGAPPVPLEDADLREVEGGRGRQPHRRVPVHAGGLQDHEGPDAARRPHHQQRLDLGARAAPELGALHRDQARDHRPDEVHRARRPRLRHRLRPDRHRQRRYTELTARMAAGRAAGRRLDRAEPLMDVEHVGDAVVYMASLPLDANVLFMTVMATKMPFVGRG